MPSSLWPQFCGGSYTTRSANADVEALFNLYPETVDEGAKTPKKTFLYGTPGLVTQTTVTGMAAGIGTLPGCRGMFQQDCRKFAVVTNTLFELTLTGSGATIAITFTNRGTMLDDGLPVFIASNGAGGNQIAIVSAGKLYIFNLSTNLLSAAIVVPLTNAAGPIVFVNGYFVMVEVGTLKCWFSELEDGTVWNGLDFFTRSNTSDNIVGIVVLHDMIKAWGTKTAEWFYNAGEADNPFLPYSGSISEDGAIIQTACGKIGEQLVWLAKNQYNVVRAMAAGAGEARVISTPAVEFAWAGYNSVSDCELLCYEQEGHPFAVFTFPLANASWAYDFREQQWHQRSRWDGTTDNFWRVRGLMAPGKDVIVCGDYTNGNIYTLSLETFSEPGSTAIHRLRRAPYLGQENQWLFLDQIELGCQTGVGNATVTNPTVNLRLSRDFGGTYNSLLGASLGVSGSPTTRAIWRRLGRARADRLVVEVSMTDAARAAWGPGLWLRATPGTGEL